MGENKILVSTAWFREFVTESNKIDRQVSHYPKGHPRWYPPHKNEPGDPSYDDHLQSAIQAVTLGLRGQLMAPLACHLGLTLNLRGYNADGRGQLRRVPVFVGNKEFPSPDKLGRLLVEWQASVALPLVKFRKNELGMDAEEREALIWRWHVEFENIHPCVDGNGRVGRLLMVNHAVLFGLEPWIVRYDERDAYYRRFDEPLSDHDMYEIARSLIKG